ncbi:MAG: ATP-binding protein [Pseudomonadota bacterium]
MGAKLQHQAQPDFSEVINQIGQDLRPEDICAAALEDLTPPSNTLLFRRFHPVKIRMNREDAQRIFKIVISNALTHGQDDGRAQIEITSKRTADDWELVVTDRGPGLPITVLQALTRPKTDEPGEASGTGLSALAQIISHYQGTLMIENRVLGGGARIQIRLPVLA